LIIKNYEILLIRNSKNGLIKLRALESLKITI
jgi:hypothetical protein